MSGAWSQSKHDGVETEMRSGEVLLRADGILGERILIQHRDLEWILSEEGYMDALRTRLHAGPRGRDVKAHEFRACLENVRHFAQMYYNKADKNDLEKGGDRYRKEDHSNCLRFYEAPERICESRSLWRIDF